MTLDNFRAVFDAERPYHDDWPTTFGPFSPTLMALLELYHRHPQARRSMRDVAGANVVSYATRVRAPDLRPRPLTPFRGLDQKQLASGEKPDDD